MIARVHLPLENGGYKRDYPHSSSDLKPKIKAAILPEVCVLSPPSSTGVSKPLVPSFPTWTQPNSLWEFDLSLSRVLQQD